MRRPIVDDHCDFDSSNNERRRAFKMLGVGRRGRTGNTSSAKVQMNLERYDNGIFSVFFLYSFPDAFGNSVMSNWRTISNNARTYVRYNL